MTIFMIACYSGHINIVKYLLEVGANPSVVDNVSISFSFSFLSDFINLLCYCYGNDSNDSMEQPQLCLQVIMVILILFNY